MPAVLVSVVIPCFNHAHFLADAIESVQLQAPASTQIVVVDDGSVDSPEQVVERFANVSLHRQENAGLAAARNAGLARSRGEFVVFLDADDRLLPGALSAGLACFENNPDSAFVWGCYRVTTTQGAHIYPDCGKRLSGCVYRSLLRSNVIAMHGAVMYRRSILQELGGFDPGLRACEDYELYLRIARRYPVAQHGAVVAEYRKHGANMSTNSPMMLETVLTVLEAQRPYVEGQLADLSAYRDGVRFWSSFYGARAIVRIMHSLLRLDFAGARSDLARVCRILGARSLLVHAPVWLLQLWRDTQRYRGTA